MYHPSSDLFFVRVFQNDTLVIAINHLFCEFNHSPVMNLSVKHLFSGPYLQCKYYGVTLLSANRSKRRKQIAFSLIELLAVLAIMATIATLSGPAIRALNGAGTVTKAAADLSRTIELARVYAMARQTHVRLVFSEIPGKGTLVMTIYSADGTLDFPDRASMENAAVWPQLGKTLFLSGMEVNDALQARTPSTTDDVKPFDSTNADSYFEKFQRQAGGIKSGSQNPSFDQFIQFSPSGEARVKRDSAARYIKVGIDKEGSGAGTNPVIIRLSGANGTLNVLRKENM